MGKTLNNYPYRKMRAVQRRSVLDDDVDRGRADVGATSFQP